MGEGREGVLYAANKNKDKKRKTKRRQKGENMLNAYALESNVSA